MNATVGDLTELIAKYNKPGPRYTSYPTAVQFREAVGEQAFGEVIANTSFAAGLSLYLHVPFCHKLCWYCGCNSVVEKNHDRMNAYVGTLLAEMGRVHGQMKTSPRVHQIHFGGGTPNQLPAETLALIFREIHQRFAVDAEAEISIELDPRRLSDEQIAAFQTWGVNRFSMGIQDFNPEVQAAINRVQPLALVNERIASLRQAGPSHLNLDLIYGLPKQRPHGFAQSVAAVIDLQPDRIALFNYAHVPWLKAHMKLIKTADLPSAEQKFEMLQGTTQQLERAGYTYIGMDHFAKDSDPLAQALRSKELHRNFQGYTTRPDLSMLAFGNSAISMFDRLYVQNLSEPRAYEAAVGDQQPLKWRGTRLNDDDVMRRGIINHLMCYGEIDPAAIEETYHLNFEETFPDARRQFEDHGDVAQ